MIRLADFSLFFLAIQPAFQPEFVTIQPALLAFFSLFQPALFSHLCTLLVTFWRFSHFFDDLITFLKNQSLLYQFSNFQPIFCINSHSHEIFPLCQGMFTIQLPVCVCVGLYRTLFSSCKIPIFSLKMVISPIFGDQGPFCPFQAVLGSILAYFLA